MGRWFSLCRGRARLAENTMSAEHHPDLQILREQIDSIDADITRLLARRFALTDQIGRYKKRHKLSPMDADREGRQVSRIRQLALEEGLNPDFAEKYLRCIMEEVVHNHKQIQAATPN